jgi:hypothetical protein
MRATTLQRQTDLFLAMQHTPMLHHSMMGVNQNSVTKCSAGPN